MKSPRNTSWGSHSCSPYIYTFCGYDGLKQILCYWNYIYVYIYIEIILNPFEYLQDGAPQICWRWFTKHEITPMNTMVISTIFSHLLKFCLLFLFFFGETQLPWFWRQCFKSLGSFIRGGTLCTNTLRAELGRGATWSRWTKALVLGLVISNMDDLQ